MMMKLVMATLLATLCGVPTVWADRAADAASAAQPGQVHLAAATGAGPQTKQLHVVERYRLNKGGKNIEITFTVEDPGAFTMPWKGKVDFERGHGDRSGAWMESICADNPRDYFADNLPSAVPIPQADKPDF